MNLSKTRRNVALLLVSFIVGMVFFIPYIRFSFYDQTLTVFQLTNTQLGTLSSIYGIVAIFCYPISGVLTQKFEPKYLLTIGLIGTAAVTLWQSFFPDYTSLIVIYCLFAFFATATLWSPYMVMLRNLGTEEEQGRIFGTSEAMRGLFSAIAGFLFVWVFSLFAEQVGGYRAILILAVVLDLIFALLCYLILPKVSAESKASGNGEKSEYKMTDALKLPGVWLMGIFIFSCYNMIITGINYLGTYTTQILGVEESISSALAIARNFIISIGAGVLAGYLADKAKSRIVFLIYLLLGAVGVTILTLIFNQNGTFTIVLTMLFSVFGFMILSTYFSVMGESGIPLALTGVASGIISFLAFLPDAFITIIMGQWLDQDLVSGFNKIFIWMAVWGSIAIIIAVIMHRRNKLLLKNEVSDAILSDSPLQQPEAKVLLNDQTSK